MALQKSTTLPSGVTADYWRVTRVEIDYENKTAQASVLLYLNATERTAGRSPVYRETFTWPREGVANDFPFTPAALDPLGENPLRVAYAQLKLRPQFAGAVDV